MSVEVAIALLIGCLQTVILKITIICFTFFFHFQRPCVCPHEGCEKSFVRAVHLKRHLLSHDGEKIFKSVLLFT